MHRLTPTPFINGSSASMLVDQYMEVHRALEDAAAVMRKWQPHGRDYQIGPGVYMDDRREVVRRLKLIEELAAQYESEAYAISKLDNRRKGAFST
jgi:hypothetical protein